MIKKLNQKVIIIAESGVNHNGDLKLAYKLIDAAKNCSADYIKFQTFNTNELILKNTKKAKYQKLNDSKKRSQYEMLKKLEINNEFHLKIINYCKKKKIKFLSSPFDIKSINLLQKFKLNTIKIPSGEIGNVPYLQHLGKLNKNIFISTGLSTINEIKKSLQILINSGTNKSKISILHCTSSYPTKLDEVNLNVIKTLYKLGYKVGYSDHSEGLIAPVAAVAIGAKIIEKHITLDKNLKGPDHIVSLEPNDFKKMVKLIRNTEKMMGSYIKKPTKSELTNFCINFLEYFYIL